MGESLLLQVCQRQTQPDWYPIATTDVQVKHVPVPDLMQGAADDPRNAALWHVKIDLSPASANPRVSAAALQHVDAAAEYGGVTGGRITGGLQYGGWGYWG